MKLVLVDGWHLAIDVFAQKLEVFRVFKWLLSEFKLVDRICFLVRFFNPNVAVVAFGGLVLVQV